MSFGEEKAADAGDEGPSGSGSGGDDEDPSTEAPQKARGKAKAEAAAAPAWDKVKWKAISEALLKEHGSGEAGAQGMKLSKLRSLAIARAVETLKIQGAGESPGFPHSKTVVGQSRDCEQCPRCFWLRGLIRPVWLPRCHRRLGGGGSGVRQPRAEELEVLRRGEADPRARRRCRRRRRRRGG